jgi:hypothetical protein
MAITTQESKKEASHGFRKANQKRQQMLLVVVVMHPMRNRTHQNP